MTIGEIAILALMVSTILSFAFAVFGWIFSAIKWIITRRDKDKKMETDKTEITEFVKLLLTDIDITKRQLAHKILKKYPEANFDMDNCKIEIGDTVINFAPFWKGHERVRKSLPKNETIKIEINV